MTTGLLDPFRHNSWANAELIAFCGRLTPDQLGATSEGTYGSILATLQHILGAEGRYRARLEGAETGWPRRPEETTDLGELAAMADDLRAFWEGLAAGPFDPDRTIEVRAGGGGRSFDVRAGVLVAQALNHGNEHRAQIFTILTTIGVQPPDLDAWSYGGATGRFVLLSEGD